jgi:hypothetical protein
MPVHPRTIEQSLSFILSLMVIPISSRYLSQRTWLRYDLKPDSFGSQKNLVTRIAPQACQHWWLHIVHHPRHSRGLDWTKMRLIGACLLSLPLLAYAEVTQLTSANFHEVTAGKSGECMTTERRGAACVWKKCARSVSQRRRRRQQQQQQQQQ